MSTVFRSLLPFTLPKFYCHFFSRTRTYSVCLHERVGVSYGLWHEWQDNKCLVFGFEYRGDWALFCTLFCSNAYALMYVFPAGCLWTYLSSSFSYASLVGMGLQGRVSGSQPGSSMVELRTIIVLSSGCSLLACCTAR